MTTMLRLRFLLAALGTCCMLGACSSIAPQIADSAIHFERSRADLVKKDVTLPDGLHMVYLEGGQGAPLVLVHGFGANKDNFSLVARWLTPRYRVIVPDLVGFGESSHPQDADYGYAAQAERLHAFVQALGLSTIDLGGNSMGGAIAMSYAAQHPREVSSLWLIDTAGVSGPPSELRKTIEATGKNPLEISNEDDFAAMLKFVMSDPPYIPRSVQDVMAQERIRNQPLEHKVFQRIALDSVEDAVRGLPTPTLVLWGAEDRVIAAGTTDTLKRLLPNAQVIVLPGVGHAPMVERPKESAEDYIRFREHLAPVQGR